MMTSFKSAFVLIGIIAIFPKRLNLMSNCTD